MSKKQMKLGAFLYPTGHHVAAWRHPEAAADAGSNIAHFRQLAEIAERAKFDLVFIADGAGMRGTEKDLAALSRTATRHVAQFEPITLLSALSAVTDRIGLVGTATTTYNEPFHIARKFASLDHLSGGRAGWNLVTSTSEHEAQNFGLDAHPPHAERYERAAEFAHVVRGLWDSFEDDAFLRDKEEGRFFDADKLHVLHHEGKHFKVRGPLNVARSPQGHPVMVQAGSSGPGKDLAAATAEVVFTAQTELEGALEFYGDLKGRLAAHDRRPDDLKILPGISPVVARTRDEAKAKFQQLQDLIQPEVGLSLLQITGGLDLRGHDIDGPVPRDLPDTEGGKSRQQLLLDMAERHGFTIRQLYMYVAGARGHWQVIGTPADIADAMQERFEAGAADGFNVMPPVLPGSLADFAELVIPELQRRGLFRTDYTGRTLRDHLELPYPRHRTWR